jgi:hypothetical protein
MKREEIFYENSICPFELANLERFFDDMQPFEVRHLIFFLLLVCSNSKAILVGQMQ